MDYLKVVDVVRKTYVNEGYRANDETGTSLSAPSVKKPEGCLHNGPKFLLEELLNQSSNDPIKFLDQIMDDCSDFQTKQNNSESKYYNEASEKAFFTSLDFVLNGLAPEVEQEVSNNLKSEQLVRKSVPNLSESRSSKRMTFNFLSIYKAATTQDNLNKIIQAKKMKPTITATDRVCSNFSGSLFEYHATQSNQSPISKQRRLFSLESQYGGKKFVCNMNCCTKEYSSKSALNHHIKHKHPEKIEQSNRYNFQRSMSQSQSNQQVDDVVRCTEGRKLSNTSFDECNRKTIQSENLYLNQNNQQDSNHDIEISELKKRNSYQFKELLADAERKSALYSEQTRADSQSSSQSTNVSPLIYDAKLKKTFECVKKANTECAYKENNNNSTKEFRFPTLVSEDNVANYSVDPNLKNGFTQYCDRDLFNFKRNSIFDGLQENEIIDEDLLILHRSRLNSNWNANNTNDMDPYLNPCDFLLGVGERDRFKSFNSQVDEY